MSKRPRPRVPFNGGAAAPAAPPRPAQRTTPPAVPRPGFVVITADNGESVQALLGPDPVEQSGGAGGWAEVERPKRSTAVYWQGLPARRLQFAMLLDGFANGASVEADCTRLRRMGRPVRPGEAPPIVRARGPWPDYGVEYAIADLQWGDALYRTDGRRVRQAVVVQLLEAVEPVVVRTSPARRTRDRRGKGRPRVHRVMRGETLQRIALRELGSASRWREIAALNRVRDPKSIKPHQRLRLP